MTTSMWLALAGSIAVSGVGSGVGAQSLDARTDVLVRSALGRDITITRLHAPDAPEGAPALLVVAGIDPRQDGSTELAGRIGEALKSDHAAALAHGDVYIIDRLNPDGFEGDPANHQPARDTARKPVKPGRIDADRDGRFNEDPTVDLDGDGRILTMRVKDPAPTSGLTAEYVVDENDPRLLRKADRAKGERPVYAMLPESQDADGDGFFGEDGFDGVELDRNFPYHWPEYHDESGRTPLSEPESRALADWVLAHPTLLALLVYEPADNLVNAPPAGKMDETNEAPATNHVLDADHPVFDQIGEKFRDITRQEKAPTRDNDGTLQGWAYAQMGLWSFTTPGWVRPDQLKQEEKAGRDDAKKDEGENKPKDDAKPDGKDAPPKDEKSKRKKGESDDAKWIALSDALVQQGKPAAFVDWKPFKHPQLGDVEIGGFVPGFKTSIPADQIDRVAKEQASFIADLLDRMPRLAVRGPWVEKLGDGVWRVSVEAVNEGKLPTRSAMGVKTHRLPPTRWKIGVERPRIVAGHRVEAADAIAAGGSLVARWTITGAAGEHVKVSLISPECGTRELDVALEEKKEGAR